MGRAGSPRHTRAQDLRDANVHISLGFARWMAKRKYWKTVGWHHSSKLYNRVYFYEPAALRRVINRLGKQMMEDLRRQYLRHLAAKRQNAKARRAPVRGEYAQWTGPGNYRRIEAWVPVQGRDRRQRLDPSAGRHQEESQLPVGTFRRIKPSRSARKRRAAEKRAGTGDKSSTNPPGS